MALIRLYNDEEVKSDKIRLYPVEPEPEPVYGEWGTPTAIPYKSVNDWKSGIIPESLSKEPIDRSKWLKPEEGKSEWIKEPEAEPRETLAEKMMFGMPNVANWKTDKEIEAKQIVLDKTKNQLKIAESNKSWNKREEILFDIKRQQKDIDSLSTGTTKMQGLRLEIKDINDRLTDNLRKAKGDLKKMPSSKVGVPMGGPGKFFMELMPSVKKAEEKRKEIRNLELATKFNNDFLKSAEKKPGLIMSYAEGVIDSFQEPEKLIPFAGTGVSLDESFQTLSAARKLEDGEKLTSYEMSLIEKARAKGLPIERKWTYYAGQVVGQMPTYIAEFAGLKSLVAAPVEAGISRAIGKGIIVNVPKGIQKVWSVPAKIGINELLAKGIGVAAQAGAFATIKTPADVAEKAIPYQKELTSPAFRDLYEDLGGEFNWKKAAIQSFGTNAVEVLTEYVGGLVQGPVNFLSKATLGKWLSKRGIVLTSKLFKDLSGKVNWNGIIGEVFEEELGELLQAPIEEREYNNPFTTPEGIERLLTETFGIAGFAGIARIPTLSIESIQKVKEKIGEKKSSSIFKETIPGQVAKATKPLIRLSPETTPEITTEVTPATPEAPVGTIKSETGVISKELQPLATEARKYKSAEEFVEAQPILYHGTNKKVGFGTGAGINKFEEGVFFVDNKQIAEAFSKITPEFLVKEAGGEMKVIEAVVNLSNPKTINYGGKVLKTSLKKEIELAKSEGHDGLIVENVIDVPTEALEKTTKPFTETVVFDKSSIKTKQQLTDFYNQATKEVKPVEIEKEFEAGLFVDKVAVTERSREYIFAEFGKKGAETWSVYHDAKVNKKMSDAEARKFTIGYVMEEGIKEVKPIVKKVKPVAKVPIKPKAVKPIFAEKNNVIQALPKEEKEVIKKYEKGEITAEELSKKLVKPKEVKAIPDMGKGEVLPNAHLVAKFAINKRSSLPILGNFLVKDGKLMATDLETGVRLNTDMKDGLYKIVGKEAVKSDLPIDDFPIVPEVKGKLVGRILSGDFIEVIKRANLSKAKDTYQRPELTGVYLEIKNNNMTVVSTDSFRLFRETISIKGSNANVNIIVDSKTFPQIMSKMDSVVEIYNEDIKDEAGRIHFRTKFGDITARTIWGEYPDYKSIYPGYDERYTLDRKKLLASLKELKPFVGRINSLVLTYKDGKFNLLAENKSENISKKITIDVTKKEISKINSESPNDGLLIMPIKSDVPKSGQFDINVKYLIDAMNVFKEDNVFMYSVKGDEYSPKLFSGKDTLKSVTKSKVKPKPMIKPKIEGPEIEEGDAMYSKRWDKAMEKGDVEEESALFAKKWEVDMSAEPETDERINKTQIMNWVEKAFGVPLKAKATQRWKAAGMYYGKAQIIRMQKWGELSVLTHELAHHIDLTKLKKEYPEGWRKGSRQIQKELADLDYDQRYRRTKEGFAEYMRHRMTTNKASEKAPVFHKFFNEFLEKNTDLKTKLASLKNKMDIWQKQGAENRIIQHIDWKGEHTKIKGIIPRVKTALQFINERFNDEFYVPQKIVRGIEKVIGRKLPPTKNPAIMMEYYKSKAGAIARTFVMDKAIDEYGNVLGPSLVEVLEPIHKDEMKQFIAYAVSKRAINLAGRNIESGFDIDDAKFIVEKYKDRGWDETTKGLTEWSNHLLDWVVRAGGLKGKTAQLMRDLNPTYLPFKRAFIDEAGVIKGVGGYVDTGGVIKGIKGSGRPIINPIEAMIAQARELISKSQKARIANAFIDIANEEGVGGFITRVPAPMKATKFNANQIADYIDEQVTGDSDMVSITKGDYDDFLTVFTQDFRYNGKENIVSVWRKGEQQFYEIHPDLYQSFKGIDPLKLGPISKVLAPFARMLRLGATGLKISFGLARNPFRDALSYVVFSKRNKVTIFDPIKGIYKDLTTKPGEAVWRFKKLGGALSGQIGLDRAATQSTYDEMLSEKLGKRGKALKVVKHPVDTLRDLLSVTEMGPRSVEMEQNYKKYTSEKWLKEHPDWNEEDAFVQAFNDAQDVTVNFTKSGKWAKQINQITAFFNVAIRGPEKVYRSFRERPISTTVKGILWLTTIAVASWYRNKDKDWYKNLPPAYKYNNLFFELPGGNIVRLPIPFELGIVFMSAPQAALDSAKDKDAKHLEGLMELAKAQIPDPIPSAFGPLIDVKTNKNYLGVPIESAGMQYLYPTERKKDYTSKLAVGMSKGLDKINFSVSPIQLDYLIDSYSGGFLRQFRISGEELSDLPVLGDLMLRDPNYPRRQLNEYFSDWEVLKQKKQSKIATREELKKLNKIDGFYNYYKDKQKKIKRASDKGDKESLDRYYKQIIERLKKYGYN